ncbi:MAG: preprotein translocase subunit YajC [Inquilinus sp.]|nr:preprotein translocase subunit YajC [Inquilinus sp.]
MGVGNLEQQNIFGTLMPIILMIAVFYFLLIRPQQKKMKTHQQMLAALRRGDRVVTGGGIIGVITKVDQEDHLTVELAENVRVKVLRGTISSVLSKTEPAKTETAATASKDEGASGGLLNKLTGKK